MDTVMDKDQLMVLGALLVLALILVVIWYFGYYRDTPAEFKVDRLDQIEGVEVYTERSRKLELEQYVRNLESAAKDIRSKAELIVDGEDRDRWFSYEQELRRRQLTVIQEIQDKEWQKVKYKPLTREEMREVERISLQEIRRLENL